MIDKKLTESIAENNKQISADLANDPAVRKQLAALQKTMARKGQKKYKDLVLLKAAVWAIEIMVMDALKAFKLIGDTASQKVSYCQGIWYDKNNRSLIEDLRAQHVYDLLKEHSEFSADNPPKDDPRFPLIARLEWEPEIADWGPATVHWASVKILLQSLGQDADKLKLSEFILAEDEKRLRATYRKIAEDD